MRASLFLCLLGACACASAAAAAASAVRAPPRRTPASVLSAPNTSDKLDVEDAADDHEEEEEEREQKEEEGEEGEETGEDPARLKQCDPAARFRSPDASCTTLLHPRLGASGTEYGRLLPAAYDDGRRAPRRGSDGRALPSGRLLSVRLLRRAPRPDPQLALAFAAWSQALAHDFALSLGPEADEATGGPLSCCSAEGRPRASALCQGVAVPARDPFFAARGVRCLTMPRTHARRPRRGARRPLNAATHALDLSSLYGATAAAAAALRERAGAGEAGGGGGGGGGGRLRTSSVAAPDGRGAARPFPPRLAAPDPVSPCAEERAGDVCFAGGDFRVNQNLPLAALHTMLLREHNRLAREFQRLNPGWDDERLFQEARRLLTAQYLHITYRHYLPHLLEPDDMAALARVNKHDPTASPATLNSFTAAAFRALHSQTPRVVALRDEARAPVQELPFAAHLFRPAPLRRPGHLDMLVRALTSEPADGADAAVEPFLADGLFGDGNATLGIDLPAFDVERGRDHGLPPFNAFRALCGLEPLRSWADADRLLAPGVGEELAALYAGPEDVDLLVGGLLERRDGGAGARLGPTLRCVAAEQFRRWKAGDRFFPEFREGPHAFYEEQLQQIQRTSLARLLCDNADYVSGMQPDAFRVPSRRNPIMNCNDTRIPRLDLLPWLDHDSQHELTD